MFVAPQATYANKGFVNRWENILLCKIILSYILDIFFIYLFFILWHNYLKSINSELRK